MDSNNFMYTPPNYHLFNTDDTSFQHNNPFDQFEASFDPIMGYSDIDPSLQPNSAYFGLSPWDPPQVQRFLHEDHKTAFFSAGAHSKIAPSRNLARPTVGIPAFPPPPQARFASPISSSDPSSAPSSVRSPPGDTEASYLEGPTTPPDMSPYPRPIPLEQWSPNARAIQFVNMGPSIEACVNPVDVDPSQQLGYGSDEPQRIDFNSPSRSFSFESYTTQFETEPAQREITATFPSKRMSSPEEMRPVVKEEIEASPQYPPPPARSDGKDDEDEESALDSPREKSLPKRKKDDDGEYTPGKKPKASSTGPPRRGRPKQIAVHVAKESPDVPPKKKQKSPTAGASSTPRAVASPSSSSKAAFACPECTESGPFKDAFSLETHIKKQHTRPFVCVFHFAGCQSTFASKNEWKRHVMTQHLVLHYWLCQEGQCSKTVNSSAGGAVGSSAKSKCRSNGSHAALNGPSSGSGTPSLPNGAIFNRKDLFTQHLRRMHTPPTVKKTIKQQEKKGGPPAGAHDAKQQWEERIRSQQRNAIQERCALPDYMRCPAKECSAEFKGTDAWDQRMEHVAKHLEKAGTDGGPRVVFGGPGDPTLMAWAAKDEVAVVRQTGRDRWVLSSPLRQSAATATVGSRASVFLEASDIYNGDDNDIVHAQIVVDDGDRDADGEVDDV